MEILSAFVLHGHCEQEEAELPVRVNGISYWCPRESRWTQHPWVLVGIRSAQGCHLSVAEPL